MRSAEIYSDTDSELGRTCEWQCQLMLKAGIEFLASHPGYDFAEPAELNAAMREAREKAGDKSSISGGQYQAVITHLTVIQSLSYQTWLTELSQARRPSEVFEFDGTLESIPRTVKQ